MPAWGFFLIILFGGIGGNAVQEHRVKKIPQFHVGQEIYQDASFYYHDSHELKPGDSPHLIKVISNGEGWCRPQRYQKLRLPFMPIYKEVREEGTLDYCTGEIYTKGKWVKP